MTSNFHGEPRTDQGHAHGVEMAILAVFLLWLGPAQV